MKQKTIARLRLVFAMFVSACSDGNVSGPGDDGSVPDVTAELPTGMVVSNALTSTASPAVTGTSSLGASATISYVSSAPGTFPDATAATIRNQTKNGPSQSVQLINGGFDPVSIVADPDDELVLTIVGKGVVTPVLVKVPRRKRPEVVRTSPPKGRTDVALNVVIAVVFSEPVAPASVNATSISLLLGTAAVAGTLTVADDGLSAAFAPSSLLEPETSYTIRIDPAVRDLDGDALTDISAVIFTTTLASGPQLLFVNFGDRNIYRIESNGTGLIRLSSPGFHLRPVWSPDGRRIAFARRDGSGADIYVMDADGSNVVRQSVTGGLWFAAWSPDGQKLVVSSEGIYDSDVYLLNAGDDVSSPVHLQTSARSPAFSPDGTKIVFVRTSGDDGYDEVYVMNADGTGAVPLTSDGGGIYRPTWSPDGQKIAFSKCKAGACDIFVMNKDGSGLHDITSVGTAQEATWSPDGKWMAVSLWVYSGSVDMTLAYIPSTGGTPVPVIAGGFHPSWRP